MSAKKAYISADMEGVAGVVGREQLFPPGLEYQQFREHMTAEVCAAIDGIRDSGPCDIVVRDSHGNGLNLLVHALPEDVQLVRAWPRPLGMMQGIDGSFDAAFLIGYHASATSVDGIAAHTISSKAFSSIRINGDLAGEATISALIAGHFDVPVVMISGDDAAVEESRELVGPLEGAVVKWQYGHSSARTLLPDAARRLIREKAQAGLARRKEIPPLKRGTELTLDLCYKFAAPAELIAYLPNVARIDNYTVRFVGTIIENSMFLEMASGYSSTAT